MPMELPLIIKRSRRSALSAGPPNARGTRGRTLRKKERKEKKMVIIIKNKIVYVRRARYSRAGWRDCRRNGACNKEATKIWTKAKEEEPLDGGGGGPLFYFLLYTHIYIYVFSFPRRANLDDPQVFFPRLPPASSSCLPSREPFFLCVCSLRFPLIQTRTV